jgi:hypothetical protein|tara:strand:- start:71 stop:664 length:594 start_codon:yes stop_codon:yes gene_type:complete
MKNYYKALAGFQQECPVLLKDTEGYGYKYVDLTKIIHSINPLMQKHGLGFTQKLGTNKETGQSCLTTTIFHVPSGESDSSTVDIPLVEMKGQNLYQAFGSGTTYFRRYQISSQLGIISDKDVDAYGEQLGTVMPKAPAVSKKKSKPKPTGDFAKDIIKVKEALAKGSKWEDAEKWLKSSDHYDAVALAEFKETIDGQ